MTNKKDIKYMNIEEFLDEGYLQEVNRRFFHPLGLALEVDYNIDGKAFLSGIWDCRDDKEGIVYSESIEILEVFKERIKKFDKQFEKRLKDRKEILGFGIQGEEK